MSTDQKIPLARTLPLFVRRKAAEEIEQSGLSLPCQVTAIVSPGIVTVAFQLEEPLVLPPATMPVAVWNYVQVPVQIGEKGAAIHMTATLAAISGVVNSPPSLALTGNLSTLLFVPAGSALWATIAGAGGAVVLNAPQILHTGNATVQNGATGSFTTPTGQTVDVVGGIIVNIY